VFDPLDQFGRSKETYQQGVPGQRKAKDTRYAFDRVLGKSATQNQVYQHTTQPLIEALLEGYNCSVFAYGVYSFERTTTMKK